MQLHTSAPINFQTLGCLIPKPCFHELARIRELALRIPPIRNDKRQLKARRRRKRKLYSLSSNREADLYIPRHFTLIARPLNQSGPRAKIIPFAHKQS